MQGSSGLTVEKFKKSKKDGKNDYHGEKSKPKNKKPQRKDKRDYEDDFA